MITFTHDETSFSLGPKSIFANDPFLNNGEEDVINGDIEITSKILNIHGVLHLLFESPSIEPFQIRQLHEGLTLRNLFLLKLMMILMTQVIQT